MGDKKSGADFRQMISCSSSMTAPAPAEGTCPQIECPRWLNNRINTFALELAMALNSLPSPSLQLSLPCRYRRMRRGSLRAWWHLCRSNRRLSLRMPARMARRCLPNGRERMRGILWGSTARQHFANHHSQCHHCEQSE